ncbi:hypothetical protein CC86DRAFT_374140 [Ophiobolus disseminans]|uniref:Uncharacterized protein n=1 Tax=Ophiobolus disseminans TaxID=1469910 RepID=A0A6A6ZJC3_9PLEO|nr:hypothetical protein CC86DRAFT_374140 [Ophiobolus disseminans]
MTESELDADTSEVPVILEIMSDSLVGMGLMDVFAILTPIVRLVLVWGGAPV